MKLVLFLILASVFVSIISLSYAEEITPKYPIMKNFPYDSQKGVEHYLIRFYTEPIYQEWYMTNFPSANIEEALGLTPYYGEVYNKVINCKSLPISLVMEYPEDEKFDQYMKIKNNCIEQTGIRGYVQAGLILADNGYHKESIIPYETAISIHDRYGVAILNKAISLYKIGEFEESNLYFESANIFNTEDVDIEEIRQSLTEKINEDAEKKTSTSNDTICGTGIIYKDGQCIVDQSSSKSLFSKGGGCLIATATYGSELAPQVQQLRELRDNSLLATESGTSFMNSFNDVYYSFSPIIADYERENPVFKEMVKIAIIPMITSLSILNYVDMNSEMEVLGYGISLILLNIGMYFGIPVAVIVGIRRI